MATEVDFANAIKTRLDEKVPTSRTIAGKPLTGDVTLEASDVGAATAAQGELADTAVQPAGLPAWGTIADKPVVVADGATPDEARGKIGAAAQQPSALETLRALRGFGTGQVRMAVVGDSTGNEEVEWPRLWMQKWGPSLPSPVRQSYKDWDSINSAWRTEIVDVESSNIQVIDNFNRTGNMTGSSPDSGAAWGGSEGAGRWTGDGATAGTTLDATLYQAMPSPQMTVTTDLKVVTTAIAGKTQTLRQYIGATTGTLNNGFWMSMVVGSTSGALTATLNKTINGTTTTLVTQTTVAGAVANSATVQDVRVTFQVSGDNVTSAIECGEQTTTLDGNLAAGDAEQLGAYGGYSAQGVPATGLGMRLDRAEIASIGSGGNDFEMWNGSIAGAMLDTFDAAKRLQIFGGSLFEVLAVSIGHNYGPRSSNEFLTGLETWLAEWKTEHPESAVLLMSQNPQFAPSVGVAAHAQRLAALRMWAKSKGYDYIPVYEAFRALPDGGASHVFADGVHPTIPPPGELTGDFGSVLWADTILSETL